MESGDRNANYATESLMPTKTHIADKCALGAAVAIHLVHSRLLSFVNSTIFLRQFILFILFGACSALSRLWKSTASLLAQYHTLSSRNRILSPPTKIIKLQIAVSFTVAVKLLPDLSCRVAGLRLQLLFVALATFVKTFTSKGFCSFIWAKLLDCAVQ